MKAKRRLKKVDVTFISLVDSGANQKTIIWKSASTEDPTIEKQIKRAKVDEEQRIVFCVITLIKISLNRLKNETKYDL